MSINKDINLKSGMSEFAKGIIIGNNTKEKGVKFVVFDPKREYKNMNRIELGNSGAGMSFTIKSPIKQR